MSVLWQQRTHGVQKRKEQQDRAVALLFLTVVIILTMLTAAYLSLAAMNVGLAGRVWQMEKEIMMRERENQALMVDIAHDSSIPSLQQRVIAMGYIPAESLMYLRITEP